MVNPEIKNQRSPRQTQSSRPRATATRRNDRSAPTSRTMSAHWEAAVKANPDESAAERTGGPAATPSRHSAAPGATPPAPLRQRVPFAACTISCSKTWRTRSALLADQSVECIGVWPPFLESERLTSRWPFGSVLFNHACGQSFCIPVDALVSVTAPDYELQDLLGTKACRRQCTRAYVFRECTNPCRRAIGWNFFVHSPRRPADLARRRQAFQRAIKKANLRHGRTPGDLRMTKTSHSGRQSRNGR